MKHIMDDLSLKINFTSERFRTGEVIDMKRWSVYDSTVGNRTIKGPDKPGSYSIIDIYENNKKLYLTWRIDG